MNLFDEEETKKKHSGFALFGSKNKSGKSVTKDTSSGPDRKLSSYYGEGSDEDIFKSDNYYQDDDDLFDSKKKNSEEQVFNFSWWEYAVLFIEALLILYTILVFSGVAPLF